MKKDKFLIPEGIHCYYGEPGKPGFAMCPYWQLELSYNADEKKYNLAYCKFLCMSDEDLDGTLVFKVKHCFINLNYEYDE